MESLAQPDEFMFERNVGHTAKRGREVEVWVEGIPEPRRGFLAGLDDEFVQLCLTRNQALANLRRDMIVSMEETGLTIGKLIRESKGTEREVEVTKLVEKVSHFQSRAINVLAGSKTDG